MRRKLFKNKTYRRRFLGCVVGLDVCKTESKRRRRFKKRFKKRFENRSGGSRARNGSRRRLETGCSAKTQPSQNLDLQPERRRRSRNRTRRPRRRNARPATLDLRRRVPLSERPPRQATKPSSSAPEASGGDALGLYKISTANRFNTPERPPGGRRRVKSSRR